MIQDFFLRSRILDPKAENFDCFSIVPAIVFYEQGTACIINVWGYTEILPFFLEV